MKKVVSLGLFSLLFFIGCGSKPAVVVDTFVPKPVPPPAPKVIRREPGSLWSEESRWNEIYTVAASRQAGEVLQMKISDAFRAKILAQIPPLPVKEEAKSDSKKDSKNKKDKKEAEPAEAKATTPVAEAKPETKTIEVTIQDVLPRGAYNVFSSQMMTFNNRDVLVTAQGNLREKDITNDPSTTTDALFNTQLDVVVKPLPEEK